MKDSQVVDEFVGYLRRNGFPELELVCRPDESNRNTKDIDAIAGNFAIEHTSIDSVQDQRRNEAWFREVFTGLETNYRKQIGFRLSITIGYRDIEFVKDRSGLNKALDMWIGKDSHAMPFGSHPGYSIENVPFSVLVRKNDDMQPGLFFFVSEPEDESFVDRLWKLSTRKISKLRNYSGAYRTILLIENGDLSLMNDEIAKHSFGEVFGQGLPLGLDEVWYADTSFETELRFLRMA